MAQALPALVEAEAVWVVVEVLPPEEESQPVVEAAESPQQARPLAALAPALEASTDGWGPWLNSVL